MAKAHDDWKVLSHGPLVKLADNLWWVEGSVPNMSLKRNMTIARLDDGRLVIHNAVALEPGPMHELESWGRPAFLLVPNGGHRLDAPAFKRRYPELTLYCPEGSRERIEEVVKIDGSYEEFPHSDAVRLETLPGVADLEGAMFVRSSDGVTLVLNDIVFVREGQARAPGAPRTARRHPGSDAPRRRTREGGIRPGRRRRPAPSRHVLVGAPR